MSLNYKTIVAAATFAGLVSGTAYAGDLTVVSWGGAYTKSQVEGYHKPWMAKTGKSIISEDYTGGLAEIKAQVESGNVSWDVVDLELSDAIRGCDEGLLKLLTTPVCRQHRMEPPHLRILLTDHSPQSVRCQILFGRQFMYMTQVKCETGMHQKRWLTSSIPRPFRGSVV